MSPDKHLAPAAYQLRRIPAREKLAAERLAQMEADLKQALQWRDERDALRAKVEQARQPLTDEQKRAMWRASPFRGNGGQIDWYVKGIEDGERAHGIGSEGGAA